MRQMGQEVLPELRRIAKELGIANPFEREPASRPFTAGTKCKPLVDLDALSRAQVDDQAANSSH